MINQLNHKNNIMVILYKVKVHHVNLEKEVILNINKNQKKQSLSIQRVEES